MTAFKKMRLMMV